MDHSSFAIRIAKDSDRDSDGAAKCGNRHIQFLGDRAPANAIVAQLGHLVALKYLDRPAAMLSPPVRFR
jgi:hypothetical protein